MKSLIVVGVGVLDGRIDTLLVFLVEQGQPEIGYFFPVNRDQGGLSLRIRMGGIFYFDFLVTHFN